MTAGPLEGLSVLITRPEGRGADLVQRIEDAGGEAIRLPVLEIDLLSSEALLRPAGRALDTFTLAIFVSVYSVRAVAAALSASGRFPRSLEVAAIGAATRDALADLGIAARHLPRGSQDSEGLLRSLAALPVSGRDVVIYRGDAGRDALARGLRDRGARVYQLACYRRRPNPSPPPGRLARWLGRPRGVLLVTSVAILDALVGQVPARDAPALFGRPVVTLSDRIAAACRDAGFRGPVVTTGDAGPGAILAALATLHGADTEGRD